MEYKYGYNILEVLEEALNVNQLEEALDMFTNEELRTAEMAIYDRSNVIVQRQINLLPDKEQYIISAIKATVNGRIEAAAKAEREEELQRRMNR